MKPTRLKRVTKLRAGGTPPVGVEHFWCEPPDGIPWIAIGDMSVGGFVEQGSRHVTQAGIADKRLPIGRAGTVLFAMYASLGAVAELAVEACWNQALLGIEAVPGVSDQRFIRYWMESLRPSLGALARSNTQDNLNAEQVGNLDFPLLSAQTQREIAIYLDIETGRIDDLISKKRRMRDALEERLLFLARALTTEQGEIGPLRRFVRAVKTGTTPPTGALRELATDEIGWYSPGDVGPHLRMLAPARSLSKRAISEGWTPMFPPDSSLVVGIGATAGRVGHNIVASTGNQQITCITPNALMVPRFLSWQLWARAEELRATAPYTTLPILNNDFLRSILLVVPAFRLQQAMVERLDQAADRVKAITDRLRTQISLLAERRQALITAAVTGDMAIPGVGCDFSRRVGV